MRAYLGPLPEPASPGYVGSLDLAASIDKFINVALMTASTSGLAAQAGDDAVPEPKVTSDQSWGLVALFRCADADPVGVYLKRHARPSTGVRAACPTRHLPDKRFFQHKAARRTVGTFGQAPRLTNRLHIGI